MLPSGDIHGFATRPPPCRPCDAGAQPVVGGSSVASPTLGGPVIEPGRRLLDLGRESLHLPRVGVDVGDLAAANALILVPSDTTTLDAGAWVTVLPLDREF